MGHNKIMLLIRGSQYCSLPVLAPDDRLLCSEEMKSISAKLSINNYHENSYDYVLDQGEKLTLQYTGFVLCLFFMYRLSLNTNLRYKQLQGLVHPEIKKYFNAINSVFTLLK